jgi:hypothetical protein
MAAGGAGEDHELATIYVHHMPKGEAGAMQYNVGAAKFYLQTIAAVQALHREVVNILDYRKEKYKTAIYAVLDSYGKKLTEKKRTPMLSPNR